MSAPFVSHRLEGTPYRLDSVLGEGAMGEVYLGEHVDLRRPAVIKLIKAKYINEGQVVSRMRREARIVARIRHDALVTIYDLGTAADGRTFIAMEWLEGDVLRRILQTRGPLPAEEACRLVAQACDGLEVAHQAGVIHRDVKPENLFVTAQGQLKVLDFGVAKPMDDGDVTSARTAAGMVLGTPRYMAPEQATGKALSPATDVYAAGCVLFELLTGYPTFEGTDARELLFHHLHSSPPTLQSKGRRAFDPELEAIVARALHKDPAQRFVRAADMASALRAFTAKGAAPSVPPRAPSVPPLPADTVRDDVHNKPTVRIDANATATSAEESTRAIAAGALVVGVSTTERSPGLSQSPDVVIGSTKADPVATTDHAFAATRTAPTEVLVDDRAPAAEVSTAPVVVRRRSLLPVAAAIALLAFVALGAFFVLRAGRSQEVATAKSEPAEKAVPSAAPRETAAVATATETASAIVSATASATQTASAEPEKPKAKTAPTAKPTVSAAPPPPAASTPAPTQSAYERARQLMNDGDLDAAEREARAAIATHGNGARLLLGEILERKGKPGLARDVYKNILNLDPNNSTAKTRLAKLGG